MFISCAINMDLIVPGFFECLDPTWLGRDAYLEITVIASPSHYPNPHAGSPPTVMWGENLYYYLRTNDVTHFVPTDYRSAFEINDIRIELVDQVFPSPIFPQTYSRVMSFQQWHNHVVVAGNAVDFRFYLGQVYRRLEKPAYVQ